jgi:undecaprenyl-diphosphatase
MTALDTGTHQYDGVHLELPPRRKYVRSPSDVLRLAVALMVTAIGFAIALAIPDTLVGFEEDLLRAINRSPDAIEKLVVGLIQVVALAFPLFVLIVFVIRRRWIRLGMVALGSAAASLMVWALDELVIERVAAPAFLDAVEFEGWVADAAWPNSPYIAGVTAALVILNPWISRRWRRAGWITLWAFVIARLVAGVNLPVDLMIALGVGWACGTAVLLLFGAPNRTATGPEIVDAMRRAGIPLATLEAASVDARGSTPYFAEDTGGEQLFIKVLTGEERSADLMFRTYRSVRLKNVGDERAFSSLRRTVEHEALVAFAATAAEVRTPRLRAVAQTGEDADSMLLAYERIEGSSLDSVPAEDITDDVMRSIWQQVAVLRHHRTAHRDLRLANIFLDGDHEPWIIDFGFSEIAASDSLLDSDVAELVASSSIKVGAERAVRNAIDVIGADAVAAAAPRMQPLALSGATRGALKGTDGLQEVRDEVERQTGVEDIPMERLERVNTRVLVMALGFGLAIYFLIPQITEVKWSTVLDANWAWAAVALGFSFLTYVGAAMAMAGSVPNRLQPWPTFEVQVGSSFVNRITPVKVGGMATNARFLVKSGVELPVAVAGIGVSGLVTFVVHISMLFVFAVWTHNSSLAVLHLPSARTTMLILLGIFLVAGLVWFLPFGRKFFLEKVWPLIKQSAGGLATVGRSPSRMALMFGGALVMDLSYIFALWASLESFGGGLSFAAVAVVFLAGTAIAQAAPTPGGIGAVEAALIVALTGFGVSTDVAVPAVFLYRIATFWVPILPGWLAFQDLQRRGEL